MTEGLWNLHWVASLWCNIYSPVYAFLSLLVRGVDKGRERVLRVLSFCFYLITWDTVFFSEFWGVEEFTICPFLDLWYSHRSLVSVSQCLVLDYVKKHSDSKMDRTFLYTHFQWQWWLLPNQCWMNLFLWSVLIETTSFSWFIKWPNKVSAHCLCTEASCS